MWSDRQEGMSKELLHYMARCLLLLHIKAAVERDQGKRCKELVANVSRLTSGNVVLITATGELRGTTLSMEKGRLFNPVAPQSS